ncbi:FHA domain-containing protein [Solirubrobacter soli]|uniref:FHA domain-containing protein n=1 Tax=Solirubrobacter soli TaxID=363832 RepID=UPI0003FEB4E1|nr:FHA domain-containing protein [Solirubrobacter soli]
MAFPAQSVAEVRARADAERGGRPFLLYRDADGRQQVFVLTGDGAPVPIGRRPDSGVTLGWDREISRVHAVLEPVGGAWTLVDDGLSSNGTFVNGTRVVARRRLDDGDVIACGSVQLTFRSPDATLDDETHRVMRVAPSALSPAQRRVLVELCRPLQDTPYGPPATNKAIAAQLHLSVDAVKTHLRRVADVLEIEDLPQNQKRAQLAWKALNAGIVTTRDFQG